MTFGLINATRWAGRSSLRTLCMACALGVRKYARSREENKTVEKQQNMCVDLGCKFIVCVSHADKALRNRDGNQEPGSAYCCLDTIHNIIAYIIILEVRWHIGEACAYGYASRWFNSIRALLPNKYVHLELSVLCRSGSVLSLCDEWELHSPYQLIASYIGGQSDNYLSSPPDCFSQFDQFDWVWNRSQIRQIDVAPFAPLFWCNLRTRASKCGKNYESVSPDILKVI